MIFYASTTMSWCEFDFATLAFSITFYLIFNNFYIKDLKKWELNFGLIVLHQFNFKIPKKFTRLKNLSWLIFFTTRTRVCLICLRYSSSEALILCMVRFQLTLCHSHLLQRTIRTHFPFQFLNHLVAHFVSLQWKLKYV